MSVTYFQNHLSSSSLVTFHRDGVAHTLILILNTPICASRFFSLPNAASFIASLSQDKCLTINLTSSVSYAIRILTVLPDVSPEFSSDVLHTFRSPLHRPLWSTLIHPSWMIEVSVPFKWFLSVMHWSCSGYSRSTCSLASLETLRSFSLLSSAETSFIATTTLHQGDRSSSPVLTFSYFSTSKIEVDTSDNIVWQDTLVTFHFLLYLAAFLLLSQFFLFFLALLDNLSTSKV